MRPTFRGAFLGMVFLGLFLDAEKDVPSRRAATGG